MKNFLFLLLCCYRKLTASGIALKAVFTIQRKTLTKKNYFLGLVLLLFLVVEVNAEPYYIVDSNSDDAINYELLRDKIMSNNARSVEEALALVPESFFENYVLMYRSRSLQGASPLYPRAIIFGNSAKFIISFNGHKSQRGYNNLETVQFKEKENRWEFREISFSASKAPVFSEANPKKCLECHQSQNRQNIDPRPNWEPYNFWPGAYASVDNTLEPVLKKEYDKAKEYGRKPYGTVSTFLEQDYLLIEEQAKEFERFKVFSEKIKPEHSRYKFLKEFNATGPLKLTKATVILNMRRVVRIIREGLSDELFNKYKYPLLSLGNTDLSNSRNLKFRCKEFNLPEQIKKEHIEVMKSYGFYDQLKIENLDGKNHPGLATRLDVLFTPLGFSTEDWSMDFKTKGRFAFEDRFSSPADSNEHLRKAVESLFPNDPVIEMSCDELREQAQAAFKDADIDFVYNQEQTRQSRPLIQRCASCHASGTGYIPNIPFDNLDKLKIRLVEEGYKRGRLLDEIIYRTGDHAPLEDQMPPSGRVDLDARDALIKMLKELVSR